MSRKGLSLIAAFCALALSFPAAADGLRARVFDGYARLVFDLDSRVEYAADVINGQLVVQFSRPIAGNIPAADEVLAPYVVGGGKLSADGRTLIYTLRPGVAMRGTFPVGNNVLIDLAAPPTPQAAQAAQATPSQPAPTAAPPSAQRPVPQAPAASAPTPATSAPQPSSSASAPPPPASNQPPLSSTVAVRTGAHPTFFRMAFDWPGQTNYSVQRQGDKLVVTFDRAAPIDIAKLNKELPAANRPASVSVDNGRSVVTIPLNADTQLRDSRSGNTVVVDLLPQAKDKPAEPATQTKTAAAEPKEQPKPAADAKNAPQPAKRPTQTAAAPAAKADFAPQGAVTVTIPWDEPTAAAVFRRAEFTWVVFDRYRQLDTAALQKAGGTDITFIEQIPVRNNTILRLLTPPDVNASVRREGLSWVLDFRTAPSRPTRAIEIRPQLVRDEASLYLAVNEAGRTIPIEDPEVGDMMLVVPVIPISSGIAPERSFADFDLITTAQGVVVIPKSDTVRAQQARNGVEILVDGGMVMSKDMAEKGETLAAKVDTNRVLNIVDWQIGHEEDYWRNKQALFAALGDERREVKQEGRTRLARFEFANGFYPEVLGILRVMQVTDPEVENTAPFRALRGATNVMMNWWADAVDDLNHLTLANDEEARFWLAAARANLGKPELQAQLMIQTGSVLRAYPPKVRNALGVIALNAVTESGDEFGARGFLDMLRKDQIDASQAPMIDYFDAKLNLKFGDPQVALSQFRKAEAGASMLYSVMALRDRLDLEYQLGTIQAPAMIEQLEKLRYRWRGDDIELGTLLRLADLYGDQKDFGTALRTLKIATGYFRDEPKVEIAAAKMTGTYERLYLDGESDKLSPVTAIALFDEFKSLLPPGEKGDEMIRRLADRLVSVELLEQAEALLERQVQFRVTGIDRARLGARLALVYLLDRQPQRAIEVLRDTQVGDAGRDLNAQRRRLEARALTDLNKVDEAILMLGADTTPESRQLRAEIYWRTQDWPNAAKALSELAPEAEQVTVENAGVILDWATALTLGGDDRTITRLRQRYIVPMSNTPYKDAFALITTPKEKGVMDVRAMRAQIEQAEHFKSFLVEYKDMLGQKPLSAMN